MNMSLREIAHARAGDKGDTSNIGVVAYRPGFYPILLEQVTPERVRSHFGSLVRGRIKRYELPQLWAINLVLEQSLGGGVTRSLSLDPHGKSYSALILTLRVDLPDSLMPQLQALQDERRRRGAIARATPA
jgi:hypothetical protein